MLHIIKHFKKFSGPFWVVVALSLLWAIANGILEFIFPTYLESLGKSYFMIGLLLSAASLSTILVDLPLGRLSDHLSRKKLMLYGLLLSPLFGLLIFVFKNNLLLFAAFALWGIAFQFWAIPKSAYLASVTKKELRAEYYGISEEFSAIGYTLGPIAGGVLLANFGELGNLSVYAGLLVIAALLLYLLLKPQLKNKNHLWEEMVHSFQYRKVMLGDIKYLKQIGSSAALLLVFAFLFAMWDGALWTLEPLFYLLDGLNPAQGGLLLGAFSLPAVLFSLLAGRLADKIGKKKTLAIGILLTGISLLFFSRMKVFFELVIVAFTAATGTALSLPSVQGLLIDHSYAHKKGQLLGMWGFFLDAGYVLGPLGAGIAAQGVGLRPAFAVFGIIFIASSAILIFVKEKIYTQQAYTQALPKKKPQRENSRKGQTPPRRSRRRA